MSIVNQKPKSESGAIWFVEEILILGTTRNQSNALSNLPNRDVMRT